MPYKKVYRKKAPYRKKKVYRKRKFGNPRRGLSTMPQTHLAKLKYFDQITIDAPAGGIPGRYVFRCNSAYDPDFTGLGHQPMGFDQYMNMYTRYRVIGAKISCTFVANDTTSADSSALCGILKTTIPTAVLPASGLVENEKCVYRTIQLGETSRPISLRYSTKKAQGLKNVMDNFEISGTVNSSPQIEDYFHIWVAPVNATQNPANVSCQVHLEYLVVFSDPIQLGQS